MDIHLFISLSKEFDSHSQMGCTLEDMHVVREKRRGLRSCFIFKCRMCNVEMPVWSKKYPEKMDLQGLELFLRVADTHSLKKCSQQWMYLSYQLRLSINITILCVMLGKRQLWKECRLLLLERLGLQRKRETMILTAFGL
ncbi:hypothetical protein PR048_001406 [Dryococelus australis]|uniref:Uncharacterized protein n=1 Tax=Dryococelus australis TaxID=614101 RepID=A0ABQ9IIM8_9NEOP|nr:hypothetical protein PR048_001406 [Dryococelus australis]